MSSSSSINNSRKNSLTPSINTSISSQKSIIKPILKKNRQNIDNDEYGLLQKKKTVANLKKTSFPEDNKPTAKKKLVRIINNNDLTPERQQNFGIDSNEQHYYKMNGLVCISRSPIRTDKFGVISPFEAELINKNGSLEYIGTITERKRQGKGKEYHKTGKIKYDGYFENNLYNDCKSTLYYQNGNI